MLSSQARFDLIKAMWAIQEGQHQFARALLRQVATHLGRQHPKRRLVIRAIAACNAQLAGRPQVGV